MANKVLYKEKTGVSFLKTVEVAFEQNILGIGNTMAKNSTALVQTFEKGLQVLEYLVEHKIVSVTNISKLMGIQKSAGYRFLNTLRLHGYVEQDDHNNYLLTDKITKMGNGIVPKMEFRHIVSRFLDELAKRNDKDGVCNLGKWNGKEVVYEVQSANFDYAQFSVGQTVPAYCSALGKAILAHLPEATVNSYIQRTPFAAFTEKTCTTGERLIQELQEIREKGYAVMDGELYLPLKGLAVPLITGNGPVRYAISSTRTLYGPIDLFIEDMLVPLQETAQDILGYIDFYHFD